MKMKSFQKRVLSNGLTIFYAHLPDSFGFEIAMNIDTGSRDESEDNNGVSHFLEHMMFRGSRNFPNSISLACAMEDFGGENNAVTSVETTVYWLRGSNKKLADAMGVFAEFFFNPNFADLEVEKSIVLQELANDYNEEGENIDAEALGMEALFGKHPMGLPIIGEQDIVKNFTTAHLNQKRAQFYQPSKCILVVSSSHPESEVFKWAESLYGNSWSHCSATPGVRVGADKSLFYFEPQKSFKHRMRLQNNADNQYSVKLILPAAGGNGRDSIIQNSLQRLLDDGISSRLPSTIREKYGLVYDIASDTAAYSDVGTFSIDATVRTDCLIPLLDRLEEELKKLLCEAPLQSEIDRIKFRYHFDLEMINEQPQRFVNREVWNQFSGQQLTVQDEMDILESLTAEDFLQCSRKIIGSPFKGFVLVGPKSKKKRESVEKFLKNLNV